MRRGTWAVVLLAVLGSAAVGGAAPPEARQRVSEATLAYAANPSLYAGTYSLLVDETMRPDYVRFSAGYVVAALQSGDSSPRVVATLKAILAAQDVTAHSPTLGLFPEDVYAGGPGLESTCQLLPLLAWVHDHGQALPSDVKDKLQPALEAAYRAVERTPAEGDHPYLTLLRAAALATAGQSLDHPEGLRAAQNTVTAWLRQQLAVGCWQGHGATAEALRLGALAWIAQTSGAQVPADLRLAVRLAYLDMLQRVQPGSGALAGAASFVQPVDYIQGGDLDRCLLYLWGGGPEPALLRPSAMYLAACAWTPEPALLQAATPPLPRTVTTVAHEGAPITRTDTYVTDLFSVGSMTGEVGMRAVPLMITLAQDAQRPTAYLFADPAPATVAAVQKDGQALVTVSFNQIGAPDREQAYLHGVLGPHADVSEVLINGEPWNGEDAAVGAGSVVAWQRGAVFLGIRLGLCGPARPAERNEVTKPGVLRWQGEGPAAELELLIYGRKQSYGLIPALDNVVVGVLAQVAAKSDAVPTLEAFSKQMMMPRLLQTTTASLERIAPVEEDPETAFLNENKPKTKTQYHYLAHLQLDSLLRLGPPPPPHPVPGAAPVAPALLHQVIDLATYRVLLTEVGGAVVTATGPWQSPLLTLPWDQGTARQTLTVPTH
jgi:hypothetical protein